MMQVTDRAITLLKETLDSKEPAPGHVFRLADEQDQISLRVAPAEDGDVMYESDGEPVLAAPPEIAERLDSRTIDVEETETGMRLFLA